MTRRSSRLPWLVLSVGLACASCLEVRDDGATDGGEGCDFCHAELGGAHAVHVDAAGPYRLQLGCADCHPLPADWFVEGHLDAVVTVRFPAGSLATTGGLTPAWDGAVCSQVYCHGASLAGAQYPEPRWTEAFEGGLDCDACHGDPPPAPHPADDGCEECHGESYAESGGLDPDRHPNGVVEWGDDGDGDGVGP
jgi:predicted CxxxxCH...CXXCH cytochrome family protein